MQTNNRATITGYTPSELPLELSPDTIDGIDFRPGEIQA
jgi:hypothetical protein